MGGKDSLAFMEGRVEGEGSSKPLAQAQKVEAQVLKIRNHDHGPSGTT